jgi:hypothetical protein
MPRKTAKKRRPARAPTKSLLAAKLVQKYFKEKKQRESDSRRPTSDLAESLALGGGTNRSYVFEAMRLSQDEPELFEMVARGALTLSQSRRAAKLRKEDPQKFKRLLTQAHSPRDAKIILGPANPKRHKARQLADPVAEIRRLWAQCDKQQRREIKTWLAARSQSSTGK